MELTDKVLINNLCDWPVYFKRLNGIGDIKVPAKVKNFAKLDVAEVQLQIQSGNVLFIGNDASKLGDHARLFIVDDEQRKELLGYTDSDNDTVALTVDAVAKLLKIRSKDEFNTQLENLVKTTAEKKMIVQVAKEAGADEVASWKMEAINNIAGQAVV